MQKQVEEERQAQALKKKQFKEELEKQIEEQNQKRQAEKQALKSVEERYQPPSSQSTRSMHRSSTEQIPNSSTSSRPPVYQQQPQSYQQSQQQPQSYQQPQSQQPQSQQLQPQFQGYLQNNQSEYKSRVYPGGENASGQLPPTGEASTAGQGQRCGRKRFDAVDDRVSN